MTKKDLKKFGYAHRAKILKRFGFNSYQAYLNSELWGKIRAAKLKKDPDCFKCGRPASQVHHQFYSIINMLGHGLDGLLSVCGSCHKWAEVNRDGSKAGLRLATRKLRMARRSRIRVDRVHEELDEQLKQRIEREP